MEEQSDYNMGNGKGISVADDVLSHGFAQHASSESQQGEAENRRKAGASMDALNVTNVYSAEAMGGKLAENQT